MSVRKLASGVLAALALLGGAVIADAKDPINVVDPFEFDPDFRWFEPVYDLDLLDMKPEKRAHTGWFATYDRLNLYAGRPDVFKPDTGENRLDGGWGNRYEIGFMLPGDKHGWMFNWTKLNVFAADTVQQERLNRYIPPVTGSTLNTDPYPPLTQPFGFPVRLSEANNLGSNFRYYNVGETTNVFKYQSYELNKTWRMTPYHYGGIAEPLIGVRYMKFRDVNAFNDYQSSIYPPPPPAIIVEPFEETLTTQKDITLNEMFGGQIGFRYFKPHDRYVLSTDFRAFFGGNWQSSKLQTITEYTQYEEIGVGAEVTNMSTTETPAIYSRNSEFYYGYDVRADLSYQLTKMFSVRAGLQAIQIGRGLWRGGQGLPGTLNGGEKDQGIFMFGATFGMNFNH
ncbi:MAG: hypothetical protein ACR2OA_07640 [Rubripirellula sp.]|jgi:hypothetical protein